MNDILIGDNGSRGKILHFSREAWVRVRGSKLDHEASSLTRTFIPDFRVMNLVQRSRTTRACGHVDDLFRMLR